MQAHRYLQAYLKATTKNYVEMLPAQSLCKVHAYMEDDNIALKPGQTLAPQ